MLPSQIRASFLWAPYLANITEHMQRWYAPLIGVPPGTAPRAPCCAAMLHADARFPKACGFWGAPYRANITEHMQRWCAPSSVPPRHKGRNALLRCGPVCSCSSSQGPASCVPPVWPASQATCSAAPEQSGLTTTLRLRPWHSLHAHHLSLQLPGQLSVASLPDLCRRAQHQCAL